MMPSALLNIYSILCPWLWNLGRTSIEFFTRSSVFRYFPSVVPSKQKENREFSNNLIESLSEFVSNLVENVKKSKNASRNCHKIKINLSLNNFFLLLTFRDENNASGEMKGKTHWKVGKVSGKLSRHIKAREKSSGKFARALVKCS